MSKKLKFIGITGSIAMGKSYVARLCIENQIPVFDSDSEVKRLLELSSVIDQIKTSFSEAICNNKIDKKILSDIVFVDKSKLNMLEEIIYPYLNISLLKFIADNSNHNIIAADLPLLFEKKYEFLCDYIINVYCLKSTQTTRALQRTGMDLQKLEMIRNNQMSSSQKNLLADYKIYTGKSLACTIEQFNKIIQDINERNNF